MATDTEYVQGKLADYIDDLLSLGVDGLRLDAAKRIGFVFIFIDLKLISRAFQISRLEILRPSLVKSVDLPILPKKSFMALGSRSDLISTLPMVCLSCIYRKNEN